VEVRESLWRSVKAGGGLYRSAEVMDVCGGLLRFWRSVEVCGCLWRSVEILDVCRGLRRCVEVLEFWRFVGCGGLRRSAWVCGGFGDLWRFVEVML
jgi:hypothetical protein